MLKPRRKYKSIMSQNETYIATSLTEKLRKRMENISTEGTEIDESIPIIYTERDSGVIASTNIRTDRFEIAREAIDKINRAQAEKIAKNKNKQQESIEDMKTAEKKQPSDGGNLS